MAWANGSNGPVGRRWLGEMAQHCCSPCGGCSWCSKPRRTRVQVREDDLIDYGLPTASSASSATQMARQVSGSSTGSSKRLNRPAVNAMVDYLGVSSLTSVVANTARWFRSGAERPSGKTMRNSQKGYAAPTQTVIILDWDDTLFPSTYVRDDLRLSVRLPMSEQDMSDDERIEAAANLRRCEQEACELLRFARRYGRVILVTLARKPWVVDSCAHFYPNMGYLIQKLQVPVIYAQEGAAVDQEQIRDAPPDEIERFWASIKGQAIADAVEEFYTQYEGQSWKNIISIGDSNFERLGTWAATEDYKWRTGISTTDGQSSSNINGQVYKVRTKTFKMVDQPTVEELTIQVQMLRGWLQHMVNLDDSFDIDLNTVDDPVVLRNIEDIIRGRKARSSAHRMLLG